MCDVGLLDLGVISNKTGKYLRAEADHLGWTPSFGQLVGARDVADPIYLALSQNDLKPGSAVWFVGDAPIDVVCSRGAGCSTVLVGSRQPGEDGDSEPDLHVTDCAALSRSCVSIFKYALSPLNPLTLFLATSKN